MNKLINEQMLKLIKSKEQDLKVIKEEINALKARLKKGDYGALKETWIITDSTSHSFFPNPLRIPIKGYKRE